MPRNRQEKNASFVPRARRSWFRKQRRSSGPVEQRYGLSPIGGGESCGINTRAMLAFTRHRFALRALSPLALPLAGPLPALSPPPFVTPSCSDPFLLCPRWHCPRWHRFAHRALSLLEHHFLDTLQMRQHLSQTHPRRTLLSLECSNCLDPPPIALEHQKDLKKNATPQRKQLLSK